MNDLANHVQDYLRLRRAMGFKLEAAGFLLPKLVAYLEAADSETLTSELAIAWATLPQGVHPIHWAHRLSAARGFARYLQTIDPAAEVPPRDVFGARHHRPTPYLWSDVDICRLIEAARLLQPELRAASCETIFGLLAASGMRIHEVLDLERDDVDLENGVLTVRAGKSGRTRVVPIHESTLGALGSYGQCRDRLFPKPSSNAFFVSSTGKAMSSGSVRTAFNQITTDLGLRTPTVRPRIHDLRHTFAMRTLLNWHRCGADIGVEMPVLSTYLGHLNPTGTYWYLEASPELMGLAAVRLYGRFGGQS